MSLEEEWKKIDKMVAKSFVHCWDSIYDPELVADYLKEKVSKSSTLNPSKMHWGQRPVINEFYTPVGEFTPHGRFVGRIHGYHVFVTPKLKVHAFDAETGTEWTEVSEDIKSKALKTIEDLHEKSRYELEKKELHSVNVHCANTAYSLAREGDLIASCNVIMDALSHGYRVGTATVDAITHILVENGHAPETFLLKKTANEKKGSMLTFAKEHNIAGALKALLFHDENGACKMRWTIEDRKEFNIRKWELYDALVKEGCTFKRVG